MKKEYDLSKLKVRKNPYVFSSKETITILLCEDVIVYFETMEAEIGMPYQTLISLYLRDCAINRRKIKFS